MISFLNEMMYDNCNIYDTVTNITTNCGTDINMADNNCYPECIATLFMTAHTCKYLFIRAGLYDGLMDILKTCSNIVAN
jgi:hypothetical protein